MTVLADANSTEGRASTLFDVWYPLQDMRWAWKIPECEVNVSGWGCGFIPLSQADDDKVMQRKKYCSQSIDFISVLESRVDRPNSAVQLILYGKLLELLARPNATVLRYLDENTFSSIRGSGIKLVDALRDEEEEEEEEQEQDGRDINGDDDSLIHPIVSMHVRHGDACDVWFEKMPEHAVNTSILMKDGVMQDSRYCFRSTVYMEQLELIRKKYGVRKVLLSTDSPDMIKLTEKYPQYEWIYLEVDRDPFERYVGSGLGHWMNQDRNNYKDNRLYLYSAIADMYLLKHGDIFLGTMSSHFSKTLYYLMIGHKMRVPPFVTLDLPLVCDVSDYCSNKAILERRQTMEEIVYRNPSCEKTNRIYANRRKDISGLPGWYRGDGDPCGIYTGISTQFFHDRFQSYLDLDIDNSTI